MAARSPAFPLPWYAKAGESTKNEEWPYAWLFPGVHSKAVHAHGEIATPAAPSALTAIFTYQVPTGMIFVLRGLMCGSNASNWTVGSGDVTFSLDVVTSGGPRPVEFYGNSSILVPLGSTELPWPILGRLEFESEETLQLAVTNNANANGGFVYGALVGHLYPAGEHRRC